MMKTIDLTPKDDIGQAIVKLKELEEHPVTPQHRKACRLGIEALEYVMCNRVATGNRWLLPSEIEEA